MIVVGSVRPGRVGLRIADCVRQVAASNTDLEIDLVDLAELALPFVDEPGHPAAGRYVNPHTIAWSERVDAADAFVFTTPEYNHSHSPALKNAIDYLYWEWFRKPVGIVSYGGISSGTRGAVSLAPVLVTLGLIVARGNLHLPFPADHLSDHGDYELTEIQRDELLQLLKQLGAMVPAATALRAVR